MKRFLPIVLSIVCIFCSFFSAFGSAGSSGDPVVTLSYINKKVIPDFEASMNQKFDAKWKPLVTELAGKLQKEQKSQLSLLPVLDNVEAAVLWFESQRSVGRGFSSRYKPLKLRKGDKVTVPPGSGLMLTAGQASTLNVAGGVFVNTARGVDVGGGVACAPGQLYLAVEGRPGFQIVSDSATVGVDGAYIIDSALSYIPRYTDLADALKAMGLFQGTNTGYQLDRAATRLEAIVMLTRFLGEEPAALKFAGDCPFDDVPAWGKPYVGYAFDKGYTNGTGTRRFSPNATAPLDQYVTFLLRALSYSDKENGDFVWSDAAAYAQRIGLFRAAEVSECRKTFLRDQTVYLSYYTLFAKPKGQSDTLLARLISRGVVTQSAADAATSAVKRTRPN